MSARNVCASVWLAVLLAVCLMGLIVCRHPNVVPSIKSPTLRRYKEKEIGGSALILSLAHSRTLDIPLTISHSLTIYLEYIALSIMQLPAIPSHSSAPPRRTRSLQQLQQLQQQQQQPLAWLLILAYLVLVVSSSSTTTTSSTSSLPSLAEVFVSTTPWNETLCIDDPNKPTNWTCGWSTPCACNDAFDAIEFGVALLEHYDMVDVLFLPGRYSLESWNGTVQVEPGLSIRYVRFDLVVPHD
mgnify:CR=1 FL=1